MEQKEGVVFFLKLLIFSIEKEIYINWKQHFVWVYFCFYWLPQEVQLDFFFFIIFSPNFLGFLKDLSKHKGGGKIFLFFSFLLLLFCEQRVGIDHFLVVVLSADCCVGCI